MTKLNAEFTSWFATPIVTITLPDTEDMNSELAQLFFGKEAQGDKHRNPTKIGTQIGDLFESTFDLFAWRDPPVQKLGRTCEQVLRDLVRTLNSYTDEQMKKLGFHYHAWFHITRYGGYQSIHYHPKATWSGIYCVQAGDKVDGRPESGAVKFYDPRGAAFMHVDPGNEQFNPTFATKPVYLTHQEGQLVLFPSWLMHEVLPYVGKSERIVVAFNSWITREE